MDGPMIGRRSNGFLLVWVCLGVVFWAVLYYFFFIFALCLEWVMTMRSICFLTGQTWTSCLGCGGLRGSSCLRSWPSLVIVTRLEGPQLAAEKPTAPGGVHMFVLVKQRQVVFVPSVVPVATVVAAVQVDQH